MVPQSKLVLTPILALPRGAVPHIGATPKDITEVHDNRPIQTKFPWDMQAANGLFVAETGTIFVSMSGTTAPSKVAVHEVWHYAETTLLTDKEISLIGAAYGVVAELKAKAGVPMRLTEPSEWAACAFVEWLGLHNSTWMVEMEEPFETLFHALASGGMAKRRTLGPRLEMDKTYMTWASATRRRSQS